MSYLKFKHTAFITALLYCIALTAQTPIENARIKLKEATTALDSIHAYQDLAWYSQASKLDSSFYYNDRAQEIIDLIQDKDAAATNIKERAGYLYRSGAYDQAVKTYNQAKKWYTIVNDSLNIAKINSNLGAVYQSMSLPEEAMSSYIAALSYFEKNSKNDLTTATILCNIGVVYKSVHSYEEALNFYLKAEEIYRRSSNKDGLINVLSNLGSVYIKMNELDLASTKLEEARGIARDKNNRIALSAILQNLGTIALEKERFTPAEDLFKQALILKLEQGDLNQISTSQASLGKVQMMNNNLQEAVKNLSKARIVFESNNNQEKLLSVYPSLNNVFARLQMQDSASHYLEKYSELSNLIAEENAASAVTEIEKKYQTEKKERQLAENKTLLLKKELDLKGRNFLLIVLGLILLVAIVSGIFFTKQQQLKNKQLLQESELREAQTQLEAQEKLQEQRLRISRDLHDNIGSQLTFIISSLDVLKYQPESTIDQLEERLEELATFTRHTIVELRDTIWAMNKDSLSINELKERLEFYCNKASTMVTGTEISVHIAPDLKTNKVFNTIEGMHIFRICQEALNNAIKYAQASQINLSFSNLDQGTRIKITDNGIGFNKDSNVGGNGIRNMKQRAADLQSLLTIDSSPGSGTSICLDVMTRSYKA